MKGKKQLKRFVYQRHQGISNIARFREVYKTKKGRLWIVMDYADGGDLSNKIRQGQSLTETQILDWFTQMCLAIKHVHDRKIIHRDLKTQNIFLTQDGIIKLGDFGIARVLNHTREKCKTMVGTPYYLSPEIIESRDYSFKTDIWSLGVILYELCTLKPPFNDKSLHGLALKIVRGQYNPLPDRYSTSVRQLVQSLLQVDPIRRPSIHDILKMPVIVNRIKSVLSESVRNIEFSHTILHKQKFVNDSLSVPYDNELRSVHVLIHKVKLQALIMKKQILNIQSIIPQGFSYFFMPPLLTIIYGSQTLHNIANLTMIKG